jgi:AcrR family transcriptional regulator
MWIEAPESWQLAFPDVSRRRDRKEPDNVTPASPTSTMQAPPRFQRGCRVSPELREPQILALAEELFAERGYRGASMDELARRAGVSKPVIYETVGSKEQLHRQVFEHAAGELATMVAEAVSTAAGSLAAQLRAGALAFFDYMDTNRHVWSMLVDDDGGGIHAQHLRHLLERQVEYVTDTMAARATASGLVVEDLQLAAAAHTLNGALESLATWWREQPQLSGEQLADWFVTIFAPGLKALLDPCPADDAASG